MTRGFTLVELIAVLAIIGLLAALSGVAMASLKPTPTALAVRAVERARAEAIRSGTVVAANAYLLPRGHPAAVPAFLSDGSSTGGTIAVDSLTLTVDRLTGLVHVRP
jgi:prepilin-type N-terminal cleavage/methylation domain-containing protein